MENGGSGSKIGRFVPRYFYALACAPYLFTIGALKHRSLLYRISEHFGLAQPRNANNKELWDE